MIEMLGGLIIPYSDYIVITLSFIMFLLSSDYIVLCEIETIKNNIEKRHRKGKRIYEEEKKISRREGKYLYEKNC